MIGRCVMWRGAFPGGTLDSAGKESSSCAAALCVALVGTCGSLFIVGRGTLGYDAGDSS